MLLTKKGARAQRDQEAAWDEEDELAKQPTAEEAAEETQGCSGLLGGPCLDCKWSELSSPELGGNYS